MKVLLISILTLLRRMLQGAAVSGGLVWLSWDMGSARATLRLCRHQQGLSISHPLLSSQRDNGASLTLSSLEPFAGRRMGFNIWKWCYKDSFCTTANSLWIHSLFYLWYAVHFPQYCKAKVEYRKVDTTDRWWDLVFRVYLYPNSPSWVVLEKLFAFHSS